MSIFNKIRGLFKSTNEIGLFQSATLRQDSGKWDETKFLKMAEISLYTNKAINKRAEKVGDINFTIENKAGDSIETPEAKTLLELLNQPNPEQTKNEFFSLYQKYKDITGSVYIEIIIGDRKLRENTKIQELRLLMPNRITPVYDIDGVLISYKYSLEKGGERAIDAKLIIASHYYDPLNPRQGVSLLKAGAKAISTENQLADYHENVLRNGGKLDGILSFKAANLTKAQIGESKKRYAEQYADAKKTGIPLFMGGEATYQSLALSPTELSYLETKGMTLNDICILTEVPKIMLATVDGVKFDNAQESRRMFLSDVIAPLDKNLVIKLSQSVMLTGEMVVNFEDPAPENIDLKLKLNDNGIKNYYMTPNEARANVGLEPIDDGDEILVPFGMSARSSDEDIEILDDEDEEEEDEDEDNEDEKKILLENIKEKKFDHPLRDKEIRKSYGALKLAKEKRNEKLFKRYLDKFFKEQRNRIVEQLAPTKSRVFRKKGLIDDVFNVEKEIKLTATEFLPILTQFLKESGDDTYRLLGNDKFDFTLSSNIASWLDKKSEVFAKQINDTTFKRLKVEFEDSLAGEETRHELIKRIEDTYSEGGKVISKGRANIIARTETGGVMTKGSFEAYKQADIPIKIWVTVGDENVRASHAMLDGEEKPLNDSFSNGLQYPREAGGSADEVVGCRCQI